MHDVREAELEEAEALENARHAVPSAGDPPEFERWLAALLAPDRTTEIREETFNALCDYFEPREPRAGQGSDPEHHPAQSS